MFLVRQQLLLNALIARASDGTDSPTSHSRFAVLVKKLQGSLTRLESFEVVTVSPGSDV